MRIGVAEDDVLMRQGIVAVLTSGGHEVVWETGDAGDTVRHCLRHRPEMLVTDVRMPPSNSDDGLRAALVIREDQSDLPVVVLSQYSGNEYARRLLAGAAKSGGGTGYLLKESVGRVSQFLATVDAVGRGDVVVDPRVVTHLLAQERHPYTNLAGREREVLALLAHGRTNSQIAAELQFSSATLERTISHIFTTMGLNEVEGNRRVLAVLEYLRHR